jgi:hypothetical protein
MFLYFDCVVGSIILKSKYNKTVPMGTPHSDHYILGPKPKNPNSTPYFSLIIPKRHVTSP